jgi:hypothetical protein
MNIDFNFINNLYKLLIDIFEIDKSSKKISIKKGISPELD